MLAPVVWAAPPRGVTTVNFAPASLKKRGRHTLVHGGPCDAFVSWNKSQDDSTSHTFQHIRAPVFDSKVRGGVEDGDHVMRLLLEEDNRVTDVGLKAMIHIIRKGA